MKNNKKLGRPTDDPKTLNTRIRLSENDVRMLEYCSKKTNLTKSEIIRRGIELIYNKIKEEEQ